MSSLRSQKQVSMANPPDTRKLDNFSVDSKQVVSSVNVLAQRLPDSSPIYPELPEPNVYAGPPFNYMGFPYQLPVGAIDAVRNPGPHGLAMLPNNYSGGDTRPGLPLPSPNSFVQQSSPSFYYPIPMPPQFHHADMERNSSIDKWFDPEMIRSMQRGGHLPPSSHQSSSGQTRLLMAEDLERERLHRSSGGGIQ
jgi:hypothetical protein